MADINHAKKWVKQHGGFPMAGFKPYTQHYWSKDYGVLDVQIRLAVLALRHAEKTRQLHETIEAAPKKTAAELLDEQKQARILEQRANALGLMGRTSVFNQASLEAPNLHNTEALEFMRLKFYEGDVKNIMLAGATGRGKTWAAVSFACAVYTHQNITFMSAYEVLEKLSRRDQYIHDKFKTVPCLIIDDLGAEAIGSENQSSFKWQEFIAFLEHIFDKRFEHKRQSIFTTNLHPKDLISTYGERFIDRFKASGELKIIDDTNWRQAV